jgi:pimeloyl-ACP methyl ester carboxylesterase
VIPPLWREGLAVAERAALPFDPVFWGLGVPRGHGRPVLLVPPFMAGDESLATMGAWLRGCGYAPVHAGLGPNVGCADALVDALADRLDAFARPPAVIGHSRGGCIARALAVRRPDRVAGVIALGSPLLDPLACHPAVYATGRAVAALGDRGVPGLMTSRCVDGDCCRRYRRELRAAFPAHVPLVSVYSRRDGVIDWRAALDPEAEQVAVATTHNGMGADASSYRVIARALGGFWPGG